MSRPGEGLPLLDDLDPSELDGCRVLVRVDMNVPITKDGSGRHVSDDFRIRAALPTLSYLCEHGARVTACTHLGRPHGPDPSFDVEPVRKRLDELLPGVSLMENLRFSEGEAANDEAFARELAAGQDLYVNDAFGSCHRRHASIVGVPRILPSLAGLLVEREVAELSPLLGRPAYPFVVVIGGAKVADKLGLLSSLADRAERVLVGGAMAFTFTEALGYHAGGSIVDRTRLDECRRLLAGKANLSLPVDFLTAEASGGDPVEVTGRVIADSRKGLDIGPATSDEYAEAIRGAGTLLWNGPMGVFEDPRFAEGTRTVARAVADCRGHSVVGGGDSAAALHELGVEERVDFVSTGGGATLELLEHGDLPGLEALRQSRELLGGRRQA